MAGWGESRESDDVLKSLARIFQISMRGLLSTYQSLFTGKDKKARKAASLSVARPTLIFVIASMLLGAGHNLFGQPPAAQFVPAVQQTARAALPPPPPGQFRDSFSLNDAGSPQIELHGIDSSHSIYFTLPQTHVARTAKIHIYYAFSPSLLPQLSHIKLILNGTLLPPSSPPRARWAARPARMPRPNS